MPTDSNLDMVSYHESERVSSSKVSTYLARGPRYYFERYVARTRKAEESEALTFGCAFEDALFAPDAYAERYTIRPEKLDLRTKDGKAWAAEHAGKPILRPDEAHVIKRMLMSVKENRTAHEMLDYGVAQMSAWCDYSGLPGLQTRPDWCDLEGSVATDWAPYVLDLKTTADLRTFGRSVATFGYHRQAAIARTVLRACGVKGARFFLLVVEKQAPYRAQLMELTRDYLDLGEREAKVPLGRIAAHYESELWPLVEDDCVSLDVPQWLESYVDDMEGT